MNLFKDIVMPVVWLPVSAFTVLAAVIAVMMSLERTLGRPIPNLRDSTPVERNRAFIAVLASMAASFVLVLPKMLQVGICDHCEHAYAWQSPAAIAAFSIIALTVSGAIGWIVFAALFIADAGWRIISRYFSN